MIGVLGGIMYIAIGSYQIEYYTSKAFNGANESMMVMNKTVDLILATASLAIINGILMLVDGALCALRFFKDS